MKFNKGDKVEQVLPAPVTGLVDGFSVDQETGDLLVHVVWQEKDADGEMHDVSKYFKAEELKPAK